MNANNYIIYFKNKEESGIENIMSQMNVLVLVSVDMAKKMSGPCKQAKESTAKWICECAFRFSNSMNGWMNSKLIFHNNSWARRERKKRRTYRDWAHREWAHVDANTVQKLVHGRKLRTSKLYNDEPSETQNKTKKSYASHTTTLNRQTVEENNLTSTFIIRATLCLLQPALLFVHSIIEQNTHTLTEKNKLCSGWFFHSKPANQPLLFAVRAFYTHVRARDLWIS